MKFTRTVWMAGILLLAAGAVAGSAQMAGHQSKKETKGGQTGTAANPWDAPQPAVEALDLTLTC